MDSTQRLEGPELEGLLDSVPGRFGPEARVVGANRCRSGGLAGFFTRESYEVFVEVPAPGAPPIRLAEGGQARAPRHVRQGPALNRAEPRSTGTDDPSFDALEHLMAAADLADGAALPDLRETLRSSPGRVTRSSGGPVRAAGFAELLEQATTEVDLTDRSMAAGRGREALRADILRADNLRGVPRSQIQGSSWPAREELDDDEDAWGADAPAGLRRGLGRLKRGRRAKRSRRAQTSDSATPEIARMEPHEAYEAWRDGHGEVALLALPPGIGVPQPPLSIERTPKRSVIYPAVTPTFGLSRRAASAGDSSVGAASPRLLAQLGVPTEWLGTSMDEAARLDAVLQHVAAAPPMYLGAGAVLAFVGELELSLPIGRSVAKALGIDPRTCVLLSPAAPADEAAYRRIRTIDEIAEQRDRWQASGSLTIVAVESSLRRRDVAWARHALDALRPTSRWGVVEATRKSDDIRQWALGLGGIDALAVHGLGDTVSPAASLATGIPVARLDGLTATRDLWMAVLGERLGEHASVESVISSSGSLVGRETAR